MVRRRKSGLSFALAAVKGKSKRMSTKKNGKDSNQGKQSGSEVSFASSRSFSSHASESPGEDQPSDRSDTSDSDSSYGCGVYHRRESLSSDSDESNVSGSSSSTSSSSGGGQSSDGSDIGSSSSREDQWLAGSDTSSEANSSTGCGVYHRRESLSQSSSSSSLSSDESESSDTSKIGATAESASDNIHSAGAARPEPNDNVPHVQRPSRRPSLSALVKAVSSKNIVKRDADDEESVPSSKGSRKKNISTKPDLSLNPSLYDDEQASMMQRRRSSTEGGRGKSLRRGGSFQEWKNKEPATTLIDGEKQDENVEDAFADLLVKVRSRKSLVIDEYDSSGEQKTKDAEGNNNVLLPRSRSQSEQTVSSTVLKSDLSMSFRTGQLANANSKLRGSVLGLTSKESSELQKSAPGSSRFASMMANFPRSCSQSEPTIAPDVNTDRPVLKHDGDIESDMSMSFRTEQLANANSNLRGSLTGDSGKELEEVQKADMPDTSAASSRFASMMANLKSSSEANQNEPAKQSIRNDDAESDDDYMFEAPKIVNETGLRNDISSTSVHHMIGDVESEREDGDHGKNTKSRFRSSILKKIAKHEKTVEVEQNYHPEDGKENFVAPDEAIGEYHSDEDDSKQTAESMSSESSGENQNSESVTNLTGSRFPEDEENSSDDYYGETGMTVLTPIIEVGSIDSDGDTANHGSDSSETDSDDGDTLNSPLLRKNDNCLVDEQDRPGNMKNEITIQEVVKRVKKNDTNLKRIDLANRGLNDFDAAKLLYSLRENTVVTHLDLANNELGNSSAVSLSQVLLGNKTITFACLRGNNVGNEGALALTKVLTANESLAHLDLNENSIDPHVIEGLQKRLMVAPSDPIPSSTRDERSPNAVENKSTYKPFESSSLLHEPTSSENKDLSGVQNDLTFFMETYSELSSDAIKTKVASRTKGFPSVSTENKDHGTLNSCNLIHIYDELSLVDEKHNQADFHDVFSSMLKPRTKTQDEAALMLAMSLARSSLDSEWVLESNTQSTGGRSSTNKNTLGDRKRLLPWMKGAKIENHDATSFYSSDEDATSMGIGSY